MFNRTDESINLLNDTEERDVLTDMPSNNSAVNRFDRFLKERKDSELKNLVALRQGIDDGGTVGMEDLKVGYFFSSWVFLFLLKSFAIAKK